MRALEFFIELIAALAHPAYLLGGIAHHEGMVLGAPCNHCSGTNKRIGSDGIAAYYRCVRPDGGAFLHKSGPQLIHTRNMCAGIEDIRENHGRPAENVILEIDSLIDGHIILDLASITHAHIRPDDHILANATTSSDA